LVSSGFFRNRFTKTDRILFRGTRGVGCCFLDDPDEDPDEDPGNDRRTRSRKGKKRG
jgi:hypothetical protein